MSAGRKQGRRPPGPVAQLERPNPVWAQRGPLLAAAVALLVYLPSLAGGFVYDDGELILRNPSIRDLKAIGAVLRYEPARPLLNLTWALNYALGGAAPWHYHLANVLIHSANAALLASLFYWMACRWGRADARQASLLGACLFAATPMAAETAAYVASRSTALSALFTLASLRLGAGVLGGEPRARLPWAMALFLLALATKEEAAALPLVLLLLDYFFVADQHLRDLARRAGIHASFVGVIPLALAARRVATGAWLPRQAIDPAIYGLTQWAAFPLYFVRALIPLDPALYRHHLPAPWPPDAATVAFGSLTAAMVVVAVARRRQWPEWSFSVACLAAGLLPSSSIVSLNEMVVDHRAYLGSIGVLFALGLLIWRLGGLRLGAVVLAVFAARSISYEWVLGDPVRAWEDSVERAPNAPDALCALAEAYVERNDGRAEDLFKRATVADPANYRYWANLGVYYSEHGRPQEAVGALRSALERKPREASVHDYLGQTLQGLGREDEAVTEFEAAIVDEPTFAPAYASLAVLALRRGEPERARQLLEAGGRYVSTAEEAEAFARARAMLP